MRKYILSVMVPIMAILFVGCASDGPKLPKVDLDIKKANMKIYVDNSLDKEKQKRVRDAFVYALRKMIKNNEFKLVKTKGYVDNTPFDVFDLRRDKIVHYGEKKFYTDGERYSHVYEFAPFYWVNLYNFIFDGKHELGKDFFGSNEYYKTDTHYTLKKIGDSSFEVKGFKTKREAIDIYLQILRDSCTYGESNFPKYAKEYLKNTKAGVDWTIWLYSKNIALYDPDELAENNKLILRPTILDASKKYQLKALLEQKHYTVVNNPKDANIIIYIKNLAFGSAREINHDSKTITNNLKHIKIRHPYTASQASFDYAQAATSFASMGTSGGNAMAGVSAALGVLSMFDTSEYDITSLDYVSIFVNGKNMINTVVSPRLYKIKEEKENFVYGIGAKVSMLNYASAMEILKLLQNTK